jgi:hypothetical protein
MVRTGTATKPDLGPRRCGQLHADGRPCGAPPLRGQDRCFWHDPGKAEELAEAQRLGGLRRRREKTVAAAYDVAGLDDIGAVRRVLEIAVLDTLGLDNSVARSRVLVGAAAAAAKLIDAEREASFGWEPE